MKKKLICHVLTLYRVTGQSHQHKSNKDIDLSQFIKFKVKKTFENVKRQLTHPHKKRKCL